MNLTRNHEVEGLISALAQWVKDLVLLCLWPAAIALIGPLAWEPPYTASVALKRQKLKKKKNLGQLLGSCQFNRGPKRLLSPKVGTQS